MKLEPHRVGGERSARQSRPLDRAFALLDPLLARPALVVESNDALGRAAHVRPLRPARPRPSCFDALLSAFSKLDNVTPSSRMPLAGGNTVRTRSMLTLRK